MRPGRRLRTAIIAVGLAAATLLGATGAGPTEAAWTDAEHARGEAINALVVPEPMTTTAEGCVARPGVLGLGPRVTIDWRIPAGNPTYAVTDAEFGRSASGLLLAPIVEGLLGDVNTTGTPTSYQTVFSGGLLGALLGGEFTLGIRLKGPGGWESDWLMATAEILPLGLTSRCTVTMQPSP